MAKRDFEVPEDRHYTEDHEWVLIEGKRARIGITDYAQDALTDVVYVELPEVGEEFAKGDSMGVVESTKSVSDIFAPVAGRVVEVNGTLDARPELLNDKPYADGWFCVLETSGGKEGLMDAAAYRKFVEGL